MVPVGHFVPLQNDNIPEDPGSLLASPRMVMSFSVGWAPSFEGFYHSTTLLSLPACMTFLFACSRCISVVTRFLWNLWVGRACWLVLMLFISIDNSQSWWTLLDIWFLVVFRLGGNCCIVNSTLFPSTFVYDCTLSIPFVHSSLPFYISESHNRSTKKNAKCDF